MQVQSLTGVVSVAAGDYYTVAFKGDGTVWTWGDNWYGQLGDGTDISRTTPVKVQGLTDVARIAPGWGHTVALKSDGTVWTWGCNEYGQLGDGTGEDAYKITPVQVKGLTDVAAIAAGGSHTVAIKSDGTVWTWGYNWNGQLGNGTDGEDAHKNTPVQVKGPDGVGYLNLYSHYDIIPVSSLTVTPTQKSLTVGQTFTITPNIFPSNATNKTVTWTTSDKSVAAINAKTGKVTAKGPAKVTITAKAGNKKATCKITVHTYVSLRIGKTRAICNGTKTTIDNAGTKPFKISGKTMLPLRFVGEKMGAKVTYVNDKKPIQAKYGKITVEFTLGSKTMSINNNGKRSTKTLAVAAQKKSGKTYVPLRAIGEALGFDVHYDDRTEIIIVNNPKMNDTVRAERLKEAKAYII